MTTSEALLARAEDLLARELSGSSRMASWLTRAALESTVRDRLVSLGFDPGEASMRSALICLEIADREHAQQAEFAWRRLSNACHHHAFELSPTAAEVRGLLDRVRSLTDHH